jgi:hypothetical protein
MWYGLLALSAIASSGFGKEAKGGDWQRLQVQVGSNLALMAGNHLLDAQRDLKEGDASKARDALIKANTVLDVIGEQAAVPTAKARLDYADRSMEFQSPDQVEAGLAPVAGELSIITNSKDNKAARKHLNKAVSYLKRGDREAARKELKSIDKLIVVRKLVVPVQATQSDIQSAITAIDKKDLEKAKASVTSAQSSMRENVFAAIDREGKRTSGITTRKAE